MGLRKILPLAVLWASCILWAQSPTYGVGRTPTAEEIRAWDISISPTGKELPPGHGTAKEGATLFRRRDARDATGQRGRSPSSDVDKRRAARMSLVHASAGMEGTHMVPDTGIMALHSPYAVTIWDYINRGMPLEQRGDAEAR